MAASTRYDLVRRIGVGGMAEVWKGYLSAAAGLERGTGAREGGAPPQRRPTEARSATEAEPVAIKKIHNHLTFNPDVRARFADEARIVAAIEHPNVVRVIDFGENDDGDCYIALEYVAGRNLAAVIRRAAESRIKIGPSIAVHVGIQVARGLGAAHAKGIIHRDVSPQNILVGWNGDVKIADFGIARVAGMETRTQVGVIRGNAAYLSPEQASQEPLDTRTDLFSLGAVLYELLLGKRLNDGANVHLLVNQAANYRFPVSEIAPLSPALQGVLTIALNRDRARRYQDAAETEEALLAVAASIPVDGRRALASLMEALFGAERTGENLPDAAPQKSVTFTTGVVRRPAPSKAPTDAAVARALPTEVGPRHPIATQAIALPSDDVTAPAPAAFGMPPPPQDRTERVRVLADPTARLPMPEMRETERPSATAAEEYVAVGPIRYADAAPRRAAWLPALMIAAVILGAMAIVAALPPPRSPAPKPAGPRAAWTYQVSKPTPTPRPH